MYRRLSGVMFPVLIIALTGSLLWGYQEHQEKNSILIKSENQYQRAFHNLTFEVDKLHNELGNTLAVNSSSRNFHRKCLVNVWRITSEAQTDINQLPLTLLPFDKTEELLANLASFSYSAAIRDLSDQPLSEKEMENLKSLYERTGEISNELRTIQSDVLNDKLRWMDVEVAIASEQEPLDNGIIDGFKTVDKKVTEFSEIDWGPSNAQMFHNRDYNQLSGNSISAEEAKKIASNMLEINQTEEIQVVENGKGTEYHTYNVQINDAEQNSNIEMDITAKGGHIVWFMNPRSVNSKKLNINQAKEKALETLENMDFKQMKAVSFDQYENVASFAFVTKQDDIIIYPQKISVKVALDNGEVVGIQTTDYIFANQDRTIEDPKLTVEEARKTLNENFKVENMDKALILNDMNEEILCYEFLGEINKQLYRIYINADTGMEEKIEQV
ncbi:germination protein YpeB [Chengkuizengella axinellae]|uniref:Germination protein YpeB n=1 Tax=Chengkuizengella axinellae TaxID=3064388 RepID=A0ABT9IWN2_9BACL|nr:germination protein YpeB [Chengkuizengella sp. 2205SS18-9]MDP5273775.1 germination protein YpeB [Chengkuizengella sp. 2205SS18-9]